MKHAALTPAPTSRGRGVSADDAPGNYASYEEYVRGFDDVPVLADAVRIPPPRPPQPDFRRGERRDVRQAARPDAYAVREQMLAEIERLYHEYTQPAPVARRAKRKKKQKRKSKKRSRASKP